MTWVIAIPHKIATCRSGFMAFDQPDVSCACTAPGSTGQLWVATPGAAFPPTPPLAAAAAGPAPTPSPPPVFASALPGVLPSAAPPAGFQPSITVCRTFLIPRTRALSWPDSSLHLPRPRTPRTTDPRLLDGRYGCYVASARLENCTRKTNALLPLLLLPWDNPVPAFVRRTISGCVQAPIAWPDVGLHWKRTGKTLGGAAW